MSRHCRTCWMDGKGPKIVFPNMVELRNHVRRKHLKLDVFG